ncbi:hypothetical protein TrST_g2586 [Triparma strigata]|uniref:PD-(D/E)XK endonuclease-like domain-containing protein n=1 Tax=Triparma strigata TaxID=1606541 RepID=A0A9W7BWS9_9STRA|nr:hypothetical protein TrST_g2586 [Triparma strigata]
MLCSSLSFCFRSQTLCSVHRVHATRVLSTTSEGSDTPTFFEPLLPKNFTGFSNLPPTRSYTLPPDVTTGDGALPFPKSLSPSSALEFNKCPQSYLLRYILNYKDPQTPVMLKGTIIHSALEKLYKDVRRPDRTRQRLHDLLRQSWSDYKRTNSSSFLEMFGTDSGTDVQAEIEWGKSALSLLDNYLEIEDPRSLPSDPVGLEKWVKSNLTSSSSTFLVRGIIDRLDLVQTDRGSVDLRITDYKSGKAPNLKYSPAMNSKIREESFWQLKVYALLHGLQSETSKEKRYEAQVVSDEGNSTKFSSGGLGVRYLRLIYLNNINGEGEVMEYDLGETEEEREEVLNVTREELVRTWEEIMELVEKGDIKEFRHCERKFCGCHKAREVFVDGTLSEEIIK